MEKILAVAGKVLVIVIPILMVGNMLVLDVWMWRIWGVLSSQTSADKPLTLLPQAVSRVDSGFACSVGCLSQIKEATASLTSKVDELAARPVPTAAVITTVKSSNGAAKEFFIPFGGGTTQAWGEDFEDMPGLESYIDSSKYSGIKKVTFEISVRVPTGNQTVWFRLYDVTDKHPVWLSEVSLSGGTPQLLISKSITLGRGNHLYKVQAKTQLRHLTIVDQARVHIVLN